MVEDAYVISDLHLGAGPGDSLEDFEHDEPLRDFVGGIARDGTTLIINGDFVDFAQIEPLSVMGIPSGLLWDEDASLAKLETSLAGHPVVFEALGEFVANGGQLRLVIGNHDLDFAWPRVQQRLRTALHDEGDRVSFIVGSDRFQGVHIEHGYQFTPENCPRDAEDFIHDWEHDGETRRYLERVWGTDFLLRFFNDLERENRYIDNVKPTIMVAYQGLRHRWLPWRGLVELAVFLKKRGIPWDAIISAVLADEEVTPWSLVGSFEDDEWRALADDAVRTDEPAVAQALDALDPEDRAVLAIGGTVEIGSETSLVAGEASTLGAFREPREQRAATDRLAADGITHVVFGHTHRIVDGDLGGALYNPGSWIPHLDLKADYVRAKIEKHGLTLELLNDRHLYVTDLRAVHIRSDPNRATVELIDCG